jgi:hypothetical protein
MRIRTYRDESRSRHFDLIGGGNDPWSVDLVLEAVSCVLLGGFAFAIVYALSIRPMPRKLLELPPEITRALLRDMRAFFACGHDTIQG